jgi:hypothetical protein
VSHTTQDLIHGFRVRVKSLSLCALRSQVTFWGRTGDQRCQCALPRMMRQPTHTCAQVKTKDRRSAARGGLCAKGQRERKSKGREREWVCARAPRHEAGVECDSFDHRPLAIKPPGPQWLYCFLEETCACRSKKQTGDWAGVLKGRVGASVARDRTNCTYHSTG